MALRSNMHLDDMVIEVTEFNSEVRADLRGHYHCCTLVFRAIALLLAAFFAFFDSLDSTLFFNASINSSSFFRYSSSFFSFSCSLVRFLFRMGNDNCDEVDVDGWD